MNSMEPDRLTGKLLFISPHLDDAVFSCGELIASHSGSVVVTVFAGLPPHPDRLSRWDALCGFRSARHAINRRRIEDCAALQLLSAVPRWLDFCDRQYRASPLMTDVAAMLFQVIQQQCPDTVLFPAGLHHPDHALVHHAMLTTRLHDLNKNWCVYEDALYRDKAGLLQQRWSALHRAGIKLTPLSTRCADKHGHKRAAANCYRSQLRALRLHCYRMADIYGEEHYWRLSCAQ